MNILRWLLILPISILCSIIFPYLYQQIAEIFVSKNTFEESYLLNGANFFLQGILFIVPAYFVAPKFKIQTLKILLILWSIVVVVGDYYLYSTTRENIGIWNSILRIIGASLAYLNITLEHKDELITIQKPENNQELKLKIFRQAMKNNKIETLEETIKEVKKIVQENKDKKK
jgi:hypothetical protein